MLCYKCGSHVPDTSDSCPNCGQKLSGGGVRQATATFSRKRTGQTQVEGAPYKGQDLVSNRYLIKDTVGAGPLGFVFRAHDKEIDVEVALKVINPRLVQTEDERRAFAKQMRLARKLSHPNLVRVYEEGEDQDRPYYTSQYLDGLTLRKIIDLRLSKGQFFSLKEIEPILAQIAAALDGAHKVGPHSDLKPENVLVLPDLLKITDFGVGLAMPRLPFVQAMKTRRADRYLAPELVEGREVDLRADLYSMGVILGEMLSGLVPDGAVPELQRRNPEVPQPIEGLYRRSLNHNPLARFKSAGEMFQEYLDITRRISPPPMPARENGSGSAPARPRTTTGMSAALQLSPRREKPPPPVPDLPPPPPPQSDLNVVPGDAVGPGAEAARLKNPRNGNGSNGHEAATVADGEGREPTEVIESGQLLQNTDDEETRVRHETVADPEAPVHPPPPAPEPRSRAMLWLVLLTVLGVGLGAGGGYWLLQRMRERTTEEIETRARAEEALRLEQEHRAQLEKDAQESERKAAEQKLAAQRAAEEDAARKERERAEAERKSAEKELLNKGMADKAVREKAEKERLAAEKAAADKAAADKLAADKAAAAEKAASEKASGDKRKPVAVVAALPAASEGPCPDGMRMVPAGTFKMGTAANDPMLGFDEKALAAVDVSGFCIDQFEFPNKRGTAPTVSVGWADARRLCEGRGRRLCSEDEWEKACKGPGNARWPFGNTFDGAACNTEDESGDKRSLAPSGRFAKCRSGYGVADLSGNAGEWTAEKIVKGGSFASPDYGVRCSARRSGGGVSKSGEVGFRCCADPK